jgi:cellulose synthase/poly-beta-1,6-N-acetylglucosamine synthase-like glycosyltransferase
LTLLWTDAKIGASSDRLVQGDVIVIYVFYFLASLLILQGLYSIREGLLFLRFVRRSLAERLSSFLPRVAILAPCKGLDPLLEENIRALFLLDYPDYHIIFAVGSIDDPALPLIERAISEHPDADARIVVAEPSSSCSEKVNNLLRALTVVDSDRETLAFVDSDTRVRADWLRSLVSPLNGPQVGATTGYRWYLPGKVGLVSAALSAWNGSVATTLGDHSRNFAWGGSTAIMRERFEQLHIADRWRHAVSDDYVLTRAVQDAGLEIKFVPRCLNASIEDPTIASLLEFTTRQIVITRVYRPTVWWVGLLSYLLFAAVFFCGLVLVLTGVFGGGTWVASSLLLLIYVLGSLKGMLRIRAAAEILRDHVRLLTGLWWMYCILWPLVSLLFLYNFLRSGATRSIEWRGVKYEMSSPSKTVVRRA